MASRSLELVLPKMIENLEGKKNIEGFQDVVALKVPINKGIEEYNKKNWIDSADKFVETWRRSENQISRHFQKGLSLQNLPSSIEEGLQWGKDITRTVEWLGICALHDAAVSYFQTPEDTATKLDKIKFGVDYKKEMNFGLARRSVQGMYNQVIHSNVAQDEAECRLAEYHKRATWSGAQGKHVLFIDDPACQSV
ncbi:hypothetical protein QC760_010617 [Botrytis cinerea]